MASAHPQYDALLSSLHPIMLLDKTNSFVIIHIQTVLPAPSPVPKNNDKTCRAFSCCPLSYMSYI